MGLDITNVSRRGKKGKLDIHITLCYLSGDCSRTYTNMKCWEGGRFASYSETSLTFDLKVGKVMTEFLS